MDVKRFDAYAELIKALIDCTGEERLVILRTHSDLVDAELLNIVQQARKILEEQGEENLAYQLEVIASRITRLLAQS
jgi:hypothetical protein